MGQKMFLMLDGVRGESQNPRHYGEIEIVGFSWGGRHQHSAGGSGKASISDLSVTKRTDRTSPILMVACHRGQYFAKAVLTIEELSEWGSMLRSMVVELKSILIESVMADGNDHDSVTFKFADLKIKHT